MRQMTPLGAIARGMASGVVGTAVMTAAQVLPSKLQSSSSKEESQSSEDQQQEPQDPWEQASVPAQLARRVIEGVFGKEAPAEAIPTLTNVMHWGYGTTWGVVFGLLQGTREGPPVRTGALFGVGVWTMSYAQLVPMGLYQPPWKYPPKELAMDLSYHLAYGAGTGLGWAAARRIGR